MSNSTERKCPFCAETIRTEAEICRFCDRAVQNAKPCAFCCEPLRAKAIKCRFCAQPQPASKPSHPPVTGIVPSNLSFGFQNPAQSPVYNPNYEPIEPKKLPEQCQAEEEFRQWRQRRIDAITHGDRDDK